MGRRMDTTSVFNMDVPHAWTFTGQLRDNRMVRTARQSPTIPARHGREAQGCRSRPQRCSPGTWLSRTGQDASFRVVNNSRPRGPGTTEARSAKGRSASDRDWPRQRSILSRWTMFATLMKSPTYVLYGFDGAGTQHPPTATDQSRARAENATSPAAAHTIAARLTMPGTPAKRCASATATWNPQCRSIQAG